ncbi:hypothetical protein RRG08_044665 [Elysia crispata]|uniref:Uncharacterized protein n=1 Tax=Elysia crispata TaxID=231223 RepID=A0AAE0Z776_9GAST|nr:hypothetical protein RRG08_044665 [Elysia crispata]
MPSSTMKTMPSDQESLNIYWRGLAANIIISSVATAAPARVRMARTSQDISVAAANLIYVGCDRGGYRAFIALSTRVDGTQDSIVDGQEINIWRLRRRGDNGISDMETRLGSLPRYHQQVQIDRYRSSIGITQYTLAPISRYRDPRLEQALTEMRSPPLNDTSSKRLHQPNNYAGSLLPT